MSKLNQQFAKINEILKKGGNVVIASHENSDSDALGSSLSLYHAFKKKNLNALCFLPDYPPKYLNFLPGFFEIKNEIPLEFSNPDIIFGLDYGDFERLGLPSSVSAKNLITIDHHRGDQRGQVKIIEPDFSSTSEIVYRFLKETGFEINKDIATCLLAGIISDSGGFCHVSTSSETIKVASDLLSKGAPLTKISRNTLGMTDQINISKIWGKALSRIKNDRKVNLAYSWVSLKDLNECQISLADLAGISSVISTISQANYSLFLVEYEKGKIKGSLRSEPFKGKNVAPFAEKLGGGGHPYAAGFRQAGTIESVLKKVTDLLE